jgi:hypothetical protein
MDVRPDDIFEILERRMSPELSQDIVMRLGDMIRYGTRVDPYLRPAERGREMHNLYVNGRVLWGGKLMQTTQLILYDRNVRHTITAAKVSHDTDEFYVIPNISDGNFELVRQSLVSPRGALRFVRESHERMGTPVIGWQGHGDFMLVSKGWIFPLHVTDYLRILRSMLHSYGRDAEHGFSQLPAYGITRAGMFFDPVSVIFNNRIDTNPENLATAVRVATDFLVEQELHPDVFAAAKNAFYMLTFTYLLRTVHSWYALTAPPRVRPEIVDAARSSENFRDIVFSYVAERIHAWDSEANDGKATFNNLFNADL